jgi:hypothetical protein
MVKEEEEEKAMRSFISEFFICPSNFVDCPSLMMEDQVKVDR